MCVFPHGRSLCAHGLEKNKTFWKRKSGALSLSIFIQTASSPVDHGTGKALVLPTKDEQNRLRFGGQPTRRTRRQISRSPDALGPQRGWAEGLALRFGHDLTGRGHHHSARPARPASIFGGMKSP